jgi:hypothetical protein
MKTGPVLVMALLAALALGACGKDLKRPSEDTLLAREAFALAEEMRAAYTGHEFRRLKGFCTADGYEELLRNIKRFESVELEFAPRWVDIKRDGAVFLNVQWEGIWHVEGGTEEERGMAVFELVGRPLRLRKVHRANPFSQPEPPEEVPDDAP